ncbi:MAG: LLM class flavin-dependent oxidoreductase [Bacteroidales bacterium]
MKKELDFYIALQGCYKPEDYIRFGKLIESEGFDRIYVYDDLMFYPSFPILNLIAEHTSRIEVGPCLVNGFYRHPALIASNAAFLDTLSHGRSVLGLGRGAFFDFLEMNDDEEFTRKGFRETMLLIRHLFEQNGRAFNGEIFKASSKAILRVDPPVNPYIISATWNPEMAYLGGLYSNEVQLAEVFTDSYFGQMYESFQKGCNESADGEEKYISLGGMICVADDATKAIEKAKLTLSVYIPYLKTILKQHDVDVNSRLLMEIDFESKRGNYAGASKLIPDEFVSMLTLSGTPSDVAARLKRLINGKSVKGIMFSPPYGISDSLEENIRYLSQNLLPKLQ